MVWEGREWVYMSVCVYIYTNYTLAEKGKNGRKEKEIGRHVAIHL